MSGALYRGAFRVCPSGCIVAEDRVEQHGLEHAHVAKLQARVEELERTEAQLDVREWPDVQPDQAPTEPVAVPPHEAPPADAAAPELPAGIASW